MDSEKSVRTEGTKDERKGRSRMCRGIDGTSKALVAGVGNGTVLGRGRVAIKAKVERDSRGGRRGMGQKKMEKVEGPKNLKG